MLTMLDLKPNWKFIDIQDNIEALISQYDGELMPFLCIHLKQKIERTHLLQQQVLNFSNIEYWQRERLWEVLNGDMGIDEFKKLGR